MISFYLIVLLIIILAVTTINPSQTDIKIISYDELIASMADDKIEEMNVNIDQYKATGTLTDGTEFTSVIIPGTFSEYINDYIQSGGEINVSYVEPQQTPWWVTLLPTLFIVVLMVVFFMMFTQQSGGGGGKVMSFGKSKARLHTPSKKGVTFKNVAGADEEKEELEEIVDFLKSPVRYLELGARIPKGVLLVGPPGTGKTLLARAVAGEAGVPFFSISGSDFVEMFVGVGASRVRDLFETAKKNSPCIIFIDEIDAVGRQRGAGLGGGHDEREQTLNQLLVEMDGFGENEGIIMIAATNRPDILDPALLRPGRFDRQILVGIPDVKGREEILKVHIKDKPLDEEIDLKTIAKSTPGFTGADLENIMNESALLAARKRKKTIGMKEMEEAIKRVIAGPEKKSRIITEHDKKITAVHEAGHAIVMKVLPNCDEVHEISIIPRGMAAGYTIALPDNDNSHISKSKIIDEISGLLGGRAAEKIMLDEICTGATNDIERATEMARKMVTEFGMSDYLGPMTFGSKHNEVFIGKDLSRSRNYSEEVAAAIDKEIRTIIDTAYKRSLKILEEHKDKLQKVSDVLLEVETINSQEFNELFNE
ncbi:ATP-dependent zinc metalloprotease FtsH [Alkalibacter mobilis]|uniref:ATP-dependent zinc metalloprotease FtsH n=1 Tax=Alkalibacter mobilis TaxID=2787712 RepID=UPI0018A0C9E8|nr:ATP-dependent zinc metalloprotease FtsH [Alkalibacter mobilis]MBF7096916.1 ATP-dependent zinc metalloprotease FtsH [Alkalibacter mobilis]